MSYLVFARKFRPQTFDEIVGQDAIVRTLKNAIEQGRIAQSFLFSGPRGVGKTSAARILAKALNCEKGPSPEPCGKCAPCREIAAGMSLDVLEIDGASNRGIDEIRNLRETVKFKPASGRVKVYIIDEVHMLTTEAFNALLKTLEEPPPHVKFVFATTESHKVPLTILSRCQRFHFKRIPLADIARKLEEIAKAEKLAAEKKALFALAKAADGSLRDAEAMLDQIASFSEGRIREEDVLLMLGLPAEEAYFSVLSALREKNSPKILSLVRELYETGKDLVQFAKGFLEMFRHLLLARSATDPEAVRPFIDLSQEGTDEVLKRRSDFSEAELMLALSILANLQSQLRRNLAPPQLLLEIALLKLLHVDGLRSLEDVAEQPSGAAIRPPSPAAGPKPGGMGGAPARPSSPPARPQAAAPAAPSAGLNEIERIWPQVIEYVKTKRMSLGIFLSESVPVEVVDGDLVVLGLPSEFQFHKETLEKNGNRDLVLEAFEVVTGRKLRVQFATMQAETPEKGPRPAAKAEPSKLPEIIVDALNIFEGSKIVRAE